jgi:hypothetical protein
MRYNVDDLRIREALWAPEPDIVARNATVLAKRLAV